MMWFSKIAIKPGLILACPVCKNKYPFGPVFDDYERVCPSCNAKIYEWHLDRKVVLIAPEHAPSRVIDFVGYLKTLSESDAYETLNLLDQVLCE